MAKNRRALWRALWRALGGHWAGTGRALWSPQKSCGILSHHDDSGGGDGSDDADDIDDDGDDNEGNANDDKHPACSHACS